LLLALEVQLRRRLERLVEPALLAQLVRRRFVAVQPVGLPLKPVPGDPQPFQILLDRVRVFLLRPLRVGVVEAQDEGAPRLARDQVVEQRRAQVPDMQVAGRRGRETGNGHR
jgi:hypothetical protein